MHRISVPIWHLSLTFRIVRRRILAGIREIEVEADIERGRGVGQHADVVWSRALG